ARRESRAGARVDEDGAGADPCPGHDRAGPAHVRGVDAPVGELGARVPRVLGPARGLRVRSTDARSRPCRGVAPELMKLDQDTLRDLVDEKWPRGQVRAIQSGYKDADRFDKYVEILQERVDWPDPIVLPFGEHLYITVPSAGKPADGSAEGPGKPADGSAEGPGKPADGSAEGPGKPADGSAEGPAYVIKCDCGHEFCDYREHWKLEALINVRETAEDLREPY